MLQKKCIQKVILNQLELCSKSHWKHSFWKMDGNGKTILKAFKEKYLFIQATTILS